MKTRSTRRLNKKQRGGANYASLPSCISDSRYMQLLQSDPEMADFYNPRAFHKKLPTAPAPAPAAAPAAAVSRANKANASLNPRNVQNSVNRNEIGVVNHNNAIPAKPNAGLNRRNVSNVNKSNTSQNPSNVNNVVKPNAALNRRNVSNVSNASNVSKPNAALNRRNVSNVSKPNAAINRRNAALNAYANKIAKPQVGELNRANALIEGLPSNNNKPIALAPAPAPAPAPARNTPVTAAYRNAPVTPNVLKPSANNANKFKVVQPAPGAYPPKVVHVNNADPKHS